MIELDMSKGAHKQVHIYLDFDGTLAYYDKWDGQFDKAGAPIPKMVANVKEWLSRGYKVTIFTARLSHGAKEAAESEVAIKQFLKDAGLPELPITCVKSYLATHFIDDKAYHVPKNTGEIQGLDEFVIED